MYARGYPSRCLGRPGFWTRPPCTTVAHRLGRLLITNCSTSTIKADSTAKAIHIHASTASASLCPAVCGSTHTSAITPAITPNMQNRRRVFQFACPFCMSYPHRLSSALLPRQQASYGSCCRGDNFLPRCQRTCFRPFGLISADMHPQNRLRRIR